MNTVRKRRPRFPSPLSSSQLHTAGLFMNAFGSLVHDSSVTQARLPDGCPLGPWPESVYYCRLDAFPCEPNVLADLILSPGEREHWRSMHAVQKRRHEWLLGRCAAKQAVRSLLERNLDLHLPPTEIEIVPDPYGRPLVSCPADRLLTRAAPKRAFQAATVRKRFQERPRPSLSIAHSHGNAVALAVLDPGARVGIDLESLTHRRQDFEAIALSPDERRLLAALPMDLRQEWALRMWCAKEAVGKALGRGLSAGLLAFHIARAHIASGIMEVELRDGARDQFPQWRGKPLVVYTARESNFVFSAIIHQQEVVRMRPSRQEILDYLLQKMGELTEDWDYPDPVRPESLLFTELGFESLDAVVLCTAIQEHYQTPMPFAELLAEIGRQQRDLSIKELTDFVDTHLGGPAENRQRHKAGPMSVRTLLMGRDGAISQNPDRAPSPPALHSGIQVQADVDAAQHYPLRMVRAHSRKNHGPPGLSSASSGHRPQRPGRGLGERAKSQLAAEAHPNVHD
jgi:phosphopantetheinyl transferase/acyl carrier protein